MAAPAPQPGYQVYFMSGRYLGKVDAVDEDRFCVSRENDAVWLIRSCVFTVEARRVTLICESDGLDNYLAPGQR